jgi:hypothetical protein
MFYELDPRMVSNLLMILKNAEFKGKLAKQVVDVMKALAEGKDKPYFKFSDEQRDLIVSIIDGTTIKGEYAFAIVAMQVALGKGIKRIPKAKKKGLTSKNDSENKGQ